MRSDFQALDRVHGAYKAASLAFPAEGASIKEMSPEAAAAALEAESEAADHAQVSPVRTHSSLLQHAEALTTLPGWLHNAYAVMVLLEKDAPSQCIAGPCLVIAPFGQR